MKIWIDANRRRIFPYAVWVAVFVVTWLRAIPSYGGPGLTWDEAFYYPTFEAASHWTGELFTNPGVAFSDEGINAGWEPIHELPPVVKWLGAACVTIPASGWWKLAFVRLFPAIASAFSFVLLYLIGIRIMPASWSIIAMILYACLPAVQGHALLAATETVFIMVTLLTAWIALHDLKKLKWKILLAVSCGLALATKVNGIILCAVIVAWLLTEPFLQARRKTARVPYRENLIAILFILILAPITAFVIWPWMWHHPIDRIAEYWSFVQNHAKQGVW